MGFAGGGSQKSMRLQSGFNMMNSVHFSEASHDTIASDKNTGFGNLWSLLPIAWQFDLVFDRSCRHFGFAMGCQPLSCHEKVS
jgi:hypothetical protein